MGLGSLRNKRTEAPSLIEISVALPELGHTEPFDPFKNAVRHYDGIFSEQQLRMFTLGADEVFLYSPVFGNATYKKTKDSIFHGADMDDTRVFRKFRYELTK